MEDFADKAAAAILDEMKSQLMVDVRRAQPYVARAIREAATAERAAWKRLVTASSREVWMRDHGGALDWDAANAERMAAVQALRNLGVEIDAASFTAD